MFESALTKRFLAVCLALVLALSCTLAAYAEDETAPPDPPPAETAAPAPEEPEPTETPDAIATPDPPAETPLPEETLPPEQTVTPVPTETPAPTQTPVPTETPAPTQTPVPTQAPMPTVPPPEYTVDSALEFLADNGISLMSTSAVGTDTEVPNFPGMHRVYLGRTESGSSALSVNICRILPDLYTRLTVDNFIAIFVDSAIGYTYQNPVFSDSFTYDSTTGILTCPHLFATSDTLNVFPLFDIYCYYNESVPETSAVVSAVTSRSCLGSKNVGQDVELPNFPGLHVRYLKNAISSSLVDAYLNTLLPDLYPLLTVANFAISPYGVSITSSSVGVPANLFAYNATTGHYQFKAATAKVRLTEYYNAAYSYDALLFYNIPDEMEFFDPIPSPSPDPSPLPSSSPSPDDPSIVPVVDPHPFWDTPFEDYTVTEGTVFLCFVLLAIYGVIKFFKRR